MCLCPSSRIACYGTCILVFTPRMNIVVLNSSLIILYVGFFFFQAEDGIRDKLVTGVQTCALPIYRVRMGSAMHPDGYFAGSALRRKAELESALRDSDAGAVICARGGYGSAALLDQIRLPRGLKPKLLVGYSDVTMLQAYLWTRLRWTSLQGPMVAANWNHGAGNRSGYDLASFLNAAGSQHDSWSLALDAEALSHGEASGLLLGGCISLLETTLGTP